MRELIIRTQLIHSMKYYVTVKQKWLDPHISSYNSGHYTLLRKNTDIYIMFWHIQYTQRLH